jgi:hypothetical protein
VRTGATSVVGAGDRDPEFAVPAFVAALPPVELYVDEYGDRGFTEKSSEVFAMTAVMVPGENAPHMRVVAAGLRAEINTAKPLHWVDHFTPKPKHAARRQLAADMVASIPGLRVVYVVAHKETLIASQHLRSDQDAFYNYVTKLLLERVAFAARHWPGGRRKVLARLGHVRGMRHEDTVAYLEAARRYGKTKAPFEYIVWPPKWYGPDRWDGLQVADIYTGMLTCALRGAHDDMECARYLVAHRHQIRRGPLGQVLGYGIKLYGEAHYLTSRTWWGRL